jgi:hypothetical protein
MTDFLREGLHTFPTTTDFSREGLHTFLPTPRAWLVKHLPSGQEWNFVGRIHGLRKSYGCRQNVFCSPFLLQCLLVLSANCVKIYTVASRRVLSSAPL